MVQAPVLKKITYCSKLKPSQRMITKKRLPKPIIQLGGLRLRHTPGHSKGGSSKPYSVYAGKRSLEQYPTMLEGIKEMMRFNGMKVADYIPGMMESHHNDLRALVHKFQLN